jgi:hypothetical protein
VGKSKIRRRITIVFALAVIGTESGAQADEVYVKYRGWVDLAPFECRETQSSFAHRVCYDAREQYMLIKLHETYYHYCEIDPGTVKMLIEADSKGRFYNAVIKGQFDCRTRRVPTYR